MPDLIRIVEALIFVSEVPLSRKRIGEVLPEHTQEEIDGAIARLKTVYDGSESHSFCLHEVAEGFQFRTRPEFKDWLIRLRRTAPVRLSRGSLETLAIIAYKQPVLRSEVERIRGVDVSRVLRSLLEKKLIRIIGRDKELAGRPLVYGTTQKFLEIFDLKDLSSLPSLAEIRGREEHAGESMDLFETPQRHKDTK
ncbi:MAG: SMC-Scp complex subunit ScpB [Pseudomonadota bacterium]